MTSYSGMTPEALAGQVWEEIRDRLQAQHIRTNDMSQDYFRPLLPRPGQTPQQLAIWDALLHSATSVSNHELIQVLNLTLVTPEDERRFLPGRVYFYIRAWTFTLPQMRNFALSMLQEGNEFHELDDWLTLLNTYAQQGVPFFTVRYVGKVSGPDNPVGRWMEEATERDSGILFEFLRALEHQFPAIAAACQVYTVDDIVIDWNTSIEPWEVDNYERVLVELLGHETLLNRQLGELHASYVPSGNDMVLFQNLRTDCSKRSWEGGRNTSRDVVNAIVVHFDYVKQMIEENPAHFGSGVRPFTKSYRDVCVTQATPQSQYQGVTLLLCIGRDVTLERYVKHRPFFGGPAQAARLTTRILERLAQTEGDTFGRFWEDLAWQPYIPYVDLWPCLIHEEIDIVITWLRQYLIYVRPLVVVSFGCQVTAVTRSNLRHQYEINQSKDKITKAAGELSIQHYDGDDTNDESAFINVPHLHPGVDKHFSQPLERRRVLDMTWHITLLAADIGMSLLDRYASEGVTKTRRQLCNEIVDRIYRDSDTGVEEFLIEFVGAKTQLLQQIRRG